MGGVAGAIPEHPDQGAVSIFDFGNEGTLRNAFGVVRDAL